MTRRRRMLTGDELALWAHVTRHVAPMAPRPPAEAMVASKPADVIADPPTKSPPPPPGKRQRPPKIAPAVAAPSPPKPAVPVLVPIERRLRQRLSRGLHPIDAVIDLHGLRQAEAHDALRGFLHGAQRAGHKVVLVVTGKGANAPDGGSMFEERGVLRRLVPHWLRQPDLRSVVVGFDEAVGHHGGSGALYVRLRRAGKLA